MPHTRICVSVTMEPQAEGEPKPINCGHPVTDHDSGGCCRVNRCPCSHLVLSKQDEFDATEPKAAKEINPLPGKAKQ